LGGIVKPGSLVGLAFTFGLAGFLGGFEVGVAFEFLLVIARLIAFAFGLGWLAAFSFDVEGCGIRGIEISGVSRWHVAPPPGGDPSRNVIGGTRFLAWQVVYHPERQRGRWGGHGVG
jgi:hypothetical protein